MSCFVYSCHATRRDGNEKEVYLPIDSKFPIGSDQIKDGAVNGDKIS